MSPVKRLVSNLKDAFAYFGVRQVFLRSSDQARVSQYEDEPAAMRIMSAGRSVGATRRTRTKATSIE
jgi:hypothetical protein